MNKIHAGRMLAAALWLSPGFAAANGNGTTAAPFLGLGVGARAAAMGEAYGAVADGADALFWNPAGLTRVKERSVTLMHATYIDSSSFDDIGYAQPAGKAGGFGLGIQRFSAGSLEKLDDTGAQAGSFTPSDTAVSLGYAGKMANGFSAGASAKYVRSTVIDTASTAAMDVGAASPAYFEGRLRLALALTNLGGKLGPDSLPSAARAASSFLVKNGWLAAFDLVAPKGGDAYASLGTEYGLPLGQGLSASLRAGYSTRNKDVQGASGFSVGMGVKVRALSVDYGFVPYGDLATTHRISLSYSFSTAPAAAPKPSVAAPKNAGKKK